MSAVETEDKAKIRELLAGYEIEALDALDESAVGVPGIVTVFAPEEARPTQRLVVRWGQRNLGLGSVARLLSKRLTGLDALVDAFPADRGQFDLLLPFWASGAIMSGFNTQMIGAEALYCVDRQGLTASPVSRQCQRLDDPSIIKPMFPKLVADMPAYVLAFKDQLTSVAAVTHVFEDRARVAVYTIESGRNRGFGRGVLTALVQELIALGIAPTASVDLGDELAVRMVENAGFLQHSAAIKVRVQGRRTQDPSLLTLRA